MEAKEKKKIHLMQNEKNMRRLWENVKCSNIQVVEIPEENVWVKYIYKIF